MLEQAWGQPKQNLVVSGQSLAEHRIAGPSLTRHSTHRLGQDDCLRAGFSEDDER